MDATHRSSNRHQHVAVKRLPAHHAWRVDARGSARGHRPDAREAASEARGPCCARVEPPADLAGTAGRDVLGRRRGVARAALVERRTLEPSPRPRPRLDLDSPARGFAFAYMPADGRRAGRARGGRTTGSCPGGGVVWRRRSWSWLELPNSATFEHWVSRLREQLHRHWVTASAHECFALARARKWPDCAILARRWLDTEPLSVECRIVSLERSQGAGDRGRLSRWRSTNTRFGAAVGARIRAVAGARGRAPGVVHPRQLGGDAGNWGQTRISSFKRNRR